MASRSSRGRGKLFHKIKDVCELTSTEPYVLRYWEQEFPFLAPEKNKAGHRIYTEADIELVRRIKKLLYDEGYTTAGARRQLERELSEAESPAQEDAPAASTAAESRELTALRKENAALAKQLKQLEADRQGLAGSLRALQARVLGLRDLVGSVRPLSAPVAAGTKKATPAPRKKAPAGKTAAAAAKKRAVKKAASKPKAKAPASRKKSTAVKTAPSASRKRATKKKKPAAKKR